MMYNSPNQCSPLVIKKHHPDVYIRSIHFRVTIISEEKNENNFVLPRSKLLSARQKQARGLIYSKRHWATWKVVQQSFTKNTKANPMPRSSKMIKLSLMTLAIC